jgi:hypothetical protein
MSLRQTLTVRPSRGPALWIKSRGTQRSLRSSTSATAHRHSTGNARRESDSVIRVIQAGQVVVELLVRSEPVDAVVHVDHGHHSCRIKVEGAECITGDQ